MARPNEDSVYLELTRQQLGILDYVLRRAQEDREFFRALTGEGTDLRGVNVLRLSLAQLVTKTGKLTGS